jgi:hypothetical protein
MPKAPAGVKRPPVEPEVEPERNRVFTRLQTVSDVAGEMSEACLMERSMPLLRGVTVGRPHVWPMPIHSFAHDFGRTGEVGQTHSASRHRAPGDQPRQPPAAFSRRRSKAAGRTVRMALHSKARQLARYGGVRTRRPFVPVPRSPHPGQTNPHK